MRGWKGSAWIVMVTEINNEPCPRDESDHLDLVGRRFIRRKLTAARQALHRAEAAGVPVSNADWIRLSETPAAPAERLAPELVVP